MIPPEESEYLRQIREAVERGEFDEEEDQPAPPVERIEKKAKRAAPAGFDADKLIDRRIAKAGDGHFMSGPVPFGYMRPPKQKKAHANAEGIVPDPETAPIVQAIFREYLRQRSMKRVITWLDRVYFGVRSWSRAGVAYILKNPVYRGTVRFGTVRATGKHQAIVAPVIYNKVQQMIRRNDKRAHMSAAPDTRGGEA